MLRIRSTVFQILRNTNTTKSRPFSSTKVCASINLAPTYDINKPQTLEKRKARLIYQSRKRGMLENDLLLSTFAKKYLEGFDEQQTILYDRLINTSNDLDLFYWAVGKEPTPKEFDNEIMHLLKKHAKNEDQQIRLQPDL